MRTATFQEEVSQMESADTYYEQVPLKKIRVVIAAAEKKYAGVKECNMARRKREQSTGRKAEIARKGPR
jgi:hypothetical protein